MVPVEDIELDRSNPRIRKFLETYAGTLTPERIALALGAGNEEDEGGTAQGTTFEKLKQSIITNGGIIQPVVLNRQRDGSLVCVEGNTRVALYRDFAVSGVKGEWSRIPAFVHENLDEDALHAIRLQVHLVGPRPWDPYSKAKYLHELRTQQHMPFAAIVDYCGGRQSEVVESINAYEDMELHYRQVIGDDGEFDIRRFSGFVELQKPGRKAALYEAGYDESDFARWLYEGLIAPLNKVRILPRILRHKEAHQVFLARGIKEAEKLLERPDLQKSLAEADLEQLSRALADRIQAMSHAEFKYLQKNIVSDVVLALREAQDELGELLGSLDDG